MSKYRDRWRAMIRRCHEESHHAFHRYGGRGITVCEEWLSLDAFSRWCESNGVWDDLEIDRIDNDKGYSPENCRVVEPSENASNRSNNRVVFIDGVRYTATDVARICGISDVAAGRRIKLWPSDTILTKGRTKKIVRAKELQRAA